jgi:hypothetical protein
MYYTYVIEMEVIAAVAVAANPRSEMIKASVSNPR